MTGKPYPIVAADDFARRFSMRAGGLMWLLGAGASAAAGIPTVWDMIWEFKQQLFVSQRRVSPKAVADLSNPAVRRSLQSFIDGLGRYPSTGAPDEYAALFEAAYPSEHDRRTYIAAKLAGAKPSFGHIALASLMKAGRTRIVWTTNFDPLVADACAKAYDGTGHLTTVALDAPDLARDALNGDRWPTEIKLHGDFRSRRLKNTGDELRQQDAILRDLLVGACGRWGLIVAGYSGRDDSIMDALEEVLEKTSPFPGGLFWLHRGEDPPKQALLAPDPPKPVEIVQLPQPLPLPGQLKPIPGARTAPPEAADPRVRVDQVNGAARVQPTRAGYINAVQVYPFSDGALYQLYAAPGEITDIALEAGEQLVGTGPVAAGDTVRWIIGDTESGSGATKRVHTLGISGPSSCIPTRPYWSSAIFLVRRESQDRPARARRLKQPAVLADALTPG